MPHDNPTYRGFCERFSHFSIITVIVTSLSLSACAYNLASAPSPPPAQGLVPPPNIPAAQANVISLSPAAWNIYYSAGMSPHPSAQSGGAWWLEIPASEGDGHVNYVQTPFNATTTLSKISITFTIQSENPQYSVVDPEDILPATVHVFFEQKGDNLIEPNGRWWAHPSMYDLGSQDGQTITYTIPLTYDQWSNVDGEQDPLAFTAAWQNVGWIGITFGGQFFWGHGVAMAGGTAKYILLNMSVS